MEQYIHPLFQYRRTASSRETAVVVDRSRTGKPSQKYLLGSFLENLTGSFFGGVSSEILSNPTFTRDANLTQAQADELTGNGKALTRLYLSGGDPAVLNPGWSYTPLETGFGMAVLDDAGHSGLPFGWAPLGYPGGVTAALGRIGGAVRLKGGDWPVDSPVHWPVAEDGPAGVRQGVFLPIHRCLDFHGELWARISTLDAQVQGTIEAGVRRRISTPDGKRQAGECLTSIRLIARGAEWNRLSFDLSLLEGQVSPGEPVDFYLRWLPEISGELELLIDRVELHPQDAQDHLDPEIIRLARDWPVPSLRWPGGNFVSYYHWRDGIGPVDRRPTTPNYAWGGLDYNLIGTDEYMIFCEKIGAEAHITVNSATGTAEEAAAWVEYCNGDTHTPMGKLRAQNGHPEPYHVRIWEVGNEVFGSWQGGNHGSDENARRFGEFAQAMRQASPIPLTLIACGNNFDFAPPGPAYDHVQADRRWHDQLLKQNPDQIDLISLHSLPVNDHLLENVTDEQAHLAVLGQITTWERSFLPGLLEHCDHATRSKDRPPIRLAITEWGPLGAHPNRLMVENFGAVVYVGAFLNMMIRNADRIPMANTTGFMHGGGIRKTYGVVYYDPQYLAVQQYRPFIGSTPYAIELSGPGYDVPHPADLGGPDQDIPLIDVVACQPANGAGILVAATNKSLSENLPVSIRIPGFRLPAQVKATLLIYPEITARANPVRPNLAPLVERVLSTDGETLSIDLPPFSACWTFLEDGLG